MTYLWYISIHAVRNNLITGFYYVFWPTKPILRISFENKILKNMIPNSLYVGTLEGLLEIIQPYSVINEITEATSGLNVKSLDKVGLSGHQSLGLLNPNLVLLPNSTKISNCLNIPSPQCHRHIRFSRAPQNS